MAESFWPGDHRAGDLFTERSFLEAMVAVEAAWANVHLSVPDCTLDIESGGNAVIPLVQALRHEHPEMVGLHQGLTSQDVLDTALVMLLRDTLAVVVEHLDRAVDAVDALTATHGKVPIVGRTLTQSARPITFGHKLDSWRAGLNAAVHDIAALHLPVQLGGPVGTEQAGASVLAERLGLANAPSWHTQRRPVTRAGDALVTATDACGRVARDVLVLCRSEIGELSEGAGGGSSSMPHKSNPVLSVLIRRAALTAPQLAATLHLAAAEQVDERADGGWHVEWDTLRILARRTVVATSQTADLLAGLKVHEKRMHSNLTAMAEGT